MKRNTSVIVLSVLAVLILAVAAMDIVLKRRQSTSHETAKSKPTSVEQKADASSLTAPASETSAMKSQSNRATASPKTVLLDSAANTNVQTSAQTNKPAGSKKKVFQDPVAREALALVGTDPYAEDYWFAALNNSALPQNERQDLVDDLNEEGFADPKHPTIDDLPLLFARLQILEEAAIWLGDKYEFEEPYRDLVHMVGVASGSSQEPIR